MTAVDEAGNRAVRYRIPGRLTGGIEITVHPDRELTDELVVAIAISAPWLVLLLSVSLKLPGALTSDGSVAYYPQEKLPNLSNKTVNMRELIHSEMGTASCPPSPAGQVVPGGQGLRVLGAQDPLIDGQQRGELVAGPGRIPRLPGPGGEVAAGGQGG